MTLAAIDFQLLANAGFPPMRFQPGDAIFEEGSPGDTMFVIRSGEVVIERGGKVMEIVPPGGIFGEMALIDDVPRMAYAAATDVTTAILVTRQMLEEKMSKADPFLRGLITIFANNLRSLAQRTIIDDSPNDPQDRDQEPSSTSS
jgi:CRP/FNR family cyclic AMP-dependent transcriptional regulator